MSRGTGMHPTESKDTIVKPVKGKAVKIQHQTRIQKSAEKRY
jgi:hypothetical protein